MTLSLLLVSQTVFTNLGWSILITIDVVKGTFGCIDDELGGVVATAHDLAHVVIPCHLGPSQKTLAHVHNRLEGLKSAEVNLSSWF